MQDDALSPSEELLRKAHQSLEDDIEEGSGVEGEASEPEPEDLDAAAISAELERMKGDSIDQPPTTDGDTADPEPRPTAKESDRPYPRLGPPGEGPISSGSRPTSPSRPTHTATEPPDTRRGLALAAGAALAGAVAWALLLAYADMQSWLLGIGIGWLIGAAALRGAGRLSSQLKISIALLAVAAVVAGQWLGIALLWNKEFGFFDLPLAIEFYFENLGELGGDVLFALGGGALGAWTAVNADKRQTRK